MGESSQRMALLGLLLFTALSSAARAEESGLPELVAPDPSVVNSLTPDAESAIEAEVAKDLPELAPIDDPRRIKQLNDLAKRLTKRRAYCRATKHLLAVEAIAGTITDNEALAAQAFFMCARIRLFQGFVAESANALQHSIAIVGERPEHRDLQFKLAIVRAREAVDEADLETIERNLEKAHELGRDLGPGAGDRLADWAVPIIHGAATKVAAWSRDLLTAGNRDMADKASAIAIRFDEHNRIAASVRRELVMYGLVLPTVGAVAGVLILAAFIWALIRRSKINRAALESDFDDP